MTIIKKGNLWILRWKMFETYRLVNSQEGLPIQERKIVRCTPWKQRRMEDFKLRLYRLHKYKTLNFALKDYSNGPKQEDCSLGSVETAGRNCYNQSPIMSRS